MLAPTPENMHALQHKHDAESGALEKNEFICTHQCKCNRNHLFNHLFIACCPAQPIPNSQMFHVYNPITTVDPDEPTQLSRTSSISSIDDNSAHHSHSIFEPEQTIEPEPAPEAVNTASTSHFVLCYTDAIVTMYIYRHENVVYVRGIRNGEHTSTQQIPAVLFDTHRVITHETMTHTITCIANLVCHLIDFLVEKPATCVIYNITFPDNQWSQLTTHSLMQQATSHAEISGKYIYKLDMQHILSSIQAVMF